MISDGLKFLFSIPYSFYCAESLTVADVISISGKIGYAAVV